MSEIEAVRSFLAHHRGEFVLPLIVLAVTLAVGYAAKRVLFGLLGGWAARHKGEPAQILVRALAGPFMIWVLILGMHLAMQSSTLPGRATLWASRILLVLWILSLTIMASSLAGKVIRFHSSGISGVLPVTTVTQTLAQLAVVLLGMLVLLNLLGISITPILTALGVGGVAVALALQDTLSNLFAGFNMAVARQIRVGDYIRLNTGEEGYVTDIAWRNTTIRTLNNNLVFIPNNKLGQANVTNFYLPQKHLQVSIQVNVSRESDPERVERVLMEEAQNGAREIPGMLGEPAPSVSFDPGFADWSLGFTLSYSVAEFQDQFTARHALRNRILKRLRQEHIDIPFPTRTIDLHGQGAS
ncbi:MAG: mechanosensitive ion channel family protein [Bryobacteraceae bacterium]|jgi:small-conductance mechanosensitive channel